MLRKPRLGRRHWVRIYILILLCGFITLPAYAAKPYPSGVYDSAGPLLLDRDFFAGYEQISGQEGILVRVDWNLCQSGTNYQCLLDKIEATLDAAEARHLKVALAISDGDRIPPEVKNGCSRLVSFVFENQPSTLCQPWDSYYLAAKTTLIQALGQRFDLHPALAHVYFTAACTTNGFEGHCRISESEFYANADPEAAPYTPTDFINAYDQILDQYLLAFANTPITFEVHAIFGQSDVWDALWASARESQRVGVASWWCAERLSLSGQETVAVWLVLQDAAQATYTVCQTLGSFTNQAYRFSSQGSNQPVFFYGANNEADWLQLSAAQRKQASLYAFTDTLDWAAGIATHGGQASAIKRYNVAEIWSVDMKNSDFQSRLATYPLVVNERDQDIPFVPLWGMLIFASSVIGIVFTRTRKSRFQ